METYDVVIIGAGHNGLSLGCYLANAGLEVGVLERRVEFGGGLSTEEVTVPGFYHNLHSNFHGAMPFFPPYQDFDLESKGVTYFHPPANIGMPLRDGRALVLYVDELRSYEEIARFSRKDAEAWMELRGQIISHIEDIIGVGFSPPVAAPELEDFLIEELRGWFGQDVGNMSAVELVKSRFENPHVQALILFHMAVGGWDIRLPRLAILGLGFLGYITNWQLCRGGSHHLAHVLGTVLLSEGGELREHCHVAKIMLDDGKAVGVITADGTKIRARQAVVSTVDPEQTFLNMLSPADLPDGLAEKVEGIEYGHGDVLFGAHVAMKEPPKYSAAAFNPDINQTFNVNIGYETPEDLIEHYEEIDRDELPKTPRLEVGVNTLFDPSQAPKGMHTAVLWQFVPYEPGGSGPEAWDKLKGEYAERCVQAWREYAPNLTPDKILGVYGYTPYDITQKLINMRKGGFHCAAVTEDQAVFRRPIPELGEMRTPIPGLYVGGASAHPHGGIIAAPAYNCFQVLAKDLGIQNRRLIGNKFWEPAHDAMLGRMRARGIKV